MKVKIKHIYTATQYNKRGDHPKVHVYSRCMPILDEKPGKENKWPKTGHLATLDECRPEDLRYQVKMVGNYYDLNLTDWIIEEGDSIINIVPHKKFLDNYEKVC